ncbi:hypothetical protein NEOLEDRAFT_1238303 [Neolentinus lepideus HHB14362 ss-1]|uniref:Uncharacterized protein n=1 Tax=Neolentinus lepideus HHB14362 ss-1 TaxID=1314782 RepID=A0A165VU05_9AGAM|nr:hypothetical protein NEOLEDRAFT_1238303 [Neolentinus lepideus HHB14362 ss-1]
MRRIADDLFSAVEASISRPALLSASMHATRGGALGRRDARRSRLNPLAREFHPTGKIITDHSGTILHVATDPRNNWLQGAGRQECPEECEECNEMLATVIDVAFAGLEEDISSQEGKWWRILDQLKNLPEDEDEEYDEKPYVYINIRHAPWDEPKATGNTEDQDHRSPGSADSDLSRLNTPVDDDDGSSTAVPEDFSHDDTGSCSLDAESQKVEVIEDPFSFSTPQPRRVFPSKFLEDWAKGCTRHSTPPPWSHLPKRTSLPYEWDSE